MDLLDAVDVFKAEGKAPSEMKTGKQVSFHGISESHSTSSPRPMPSNGLQHAHDAR